MLDKEDEYRLRARGIFLRKKDPNKVDGKTYDFIGTAVADGDVVQVCARAYNYSLGKDANNFSVRFEYIAYDGDSNTEAGHRKLIGNATTSVPARKNTTGVPMREVCTDWDTTGLSNTIVDGVIYDTYRLWVTLDPDDKVPGELHEWLHTDGTKLKHGNNEGYWPWGSGILVGPQRRQGEGLGDPINPIDLHMHEDSLTLHLGSGMTGMLEDELSIPISQRVLLRAEVHTDGDHPHHRYVFFYDGLPEEGGTLIGARTIFGLQKGENHAWMDWTPETAGEHVIYANVLEDSEDTNPRNAWDTLTVNVEEEQGRSEDKGEGGCGCSVTDEDASPLGALWIIALLAFALVVRGLGSRTTESERKH
jgi:MYXO-CTERM domain-containing protein